jgi:small neutral amino acid transporter SnatA (MarC family)
LQFPRRRFLLTIFIARSLRYYVEGTLAVFYGERVLRFIRDNGLMIVTVVGGVCLLALAIYLLSSRGRAAVKAAKE